MKLKKLIKRFKFQRKKKRVRTSCNEDLDLTFLSQMDHFHLIKSQIQEMADAFMFFDKNGDGVITEKELGEVMRTVGENPTERELLEMIAEVDIDGSGTVDFKEFLMLMSRKLTSEDMENDIRAAFKVFDRNGDGFISAAELRTTMTNIGYTLTEEEMSQFMTDADLDGDGQITYEEFAKMLLG